MQIILFDVTAWEINWFINVKQHNSLFQYADLYELSVCCGTAENNMDLKMTNFVKVGVKLFVAAYFS